MRTGRAGIGVRCWRPVHGCYPLLVSGERVLLRSREGSSQESRGARGAQEGWVVLSPAVDHRGYLSRLPPLPSRKHWGYPNIPPSRRRRLLLPGVVVWACLRFCSLELRFISLKHPLARHPAICSALRKTRLALCFCSTWQAPCGGWPSPAHPQSRWLSPPAPPS